MSLVVSPEFARAMALELVRRYDFDPNFVFATVLLFVVFTFGFVVGSFYGSYTRVRSLEDVISFFPVREGQYSVLVTRTGECFSHFRTLPRPTSRTATSTKEGLQSLLCRHSTPFWSYSYTC